MVAEFPPVTQRLTNPAHHRLGGMASGRKEPRWIEKHQFWVLQEVSERARAHEASRVLAYRRAKTTHHKQITGRPRPDISIVSGGTIRQSLIRRRTGSELAIGGKYGVAAGIKPPRETRVPPDKEDEPSGDVKVV
jgi:hypothetical protein